MNKKYYSKLVKTLPQFKLDAVLICPSEELEFIAGFNIMMCERFQGLFIKADGSSFYVCNLLYKGEVSQHLDKDIPIYTWFDGDLMTDTLKEIIEKQNLTGKIIGVNSSAQAFNILDLMDNIDLKFHNAKPLLEEIRISKDHEELENLRLSAKIADKAFSNTVKYIKSGMKEEQVHQFLHTEMEKEGGSNCWSIVASGPNSSYPHYTGDQRILKKGDPVVLDFGCLYKGQYSDMTRTVFVEEVSDRFKKLYDIVNECQLAGQNTAKLGTPACDVDRAARDVLQEYGYAETLTTRVGHGIGYMMHEAPEMKQSNKRPLEIGNAFSIEPGIYITGDIGIRIENIVIINENGETEILNKSSRELLIVGK